MCPGPLAGDRDSKSLLCRLKSAPFSELILNLNLDVTALAGETTPKIDAFRC
jgi:hypothetical protein